MLGSLQEGKILCKFSRRSASYTSKYEYMSFEFSDAVSVFCIQSSDYLVSLLSDIVNSL